MLPEESSVTPGISLLPRTRGPIPDRNKSSPTRFACGNAPTGSGARSLLKLSFIAYLHSSRSIQSMQDFSIRYKRNLLIRTLPPDGAFVERAEAFYWRQDFFKGGAVNVPNG